MIGHIKTLTVSKETLFIYKPILIKLLGLKHPTHLLKKCCRIMADDFRREVIDYDIFKEIDNLHFISDISIVDSDTEAMMNQYIDDEYNTDYLCIYEMIKPFYYKEIPNNIREIIFDYVYKYNLYKLLGSDEFGNVGLDKELIS